MEPRPWSKQLGTRLAAPDAFMHRRLRLAGEWLTESGRWRAIAEEETAALWSILGYLRWNGPALMAQDPEAARFESPDAYLASRPLVAAIDGELARRGASAPGSALVLLRTLGMAPWELPAPPRRRTSGSTA